MSAPGRTAELLVVGAGPFMDLDAGSLQLRPQRGTLAHLLDHLGHTAEQPGIVEAWLADFDAVAGQLAGVAHQPRSVRERADGRGTIVRRHAAELAVGHERGAGG